MGARVSSAGAALGSIVVGVSSAGRGRGSGIDDAPRRGRLVPVPVTWRNQVTKSRAVSDRGGAGASRRGGGVGGAWALTGGAVNNRNDRENAPALNTVGLTVIPLPLRDCSQLDVAVEPK